MNKRHVWRYDPYPDTPYPWMVSEGDGEAIGFGWWSDAVRCAFEAPAGRLADYATQHGIMVMV